MYVCIGASALALVLPMKIQGWFPLGLMGLLFLLSKDFQESSTALQFEASILWHSAFLMAHCHIMPPSIVMVMLLSQGVRPGFQKGCSSNDSKGLFCCSVTKLCSTLCNRVNCSMRGSPVLHYILEFDQIQAH